MLEKEKNGFKSQIQVSNVDFDTALECTGYGKFNLILILICGFAFLGINNEGYSVSYVLPSAECDLQLTTVTKGILSSSNFIGIMGSCCVWGYLSDTKGRQKILGITFLLSFITSVTSAVMPSFWGFTIFRFLNGIFISGPSAIVFAYFGEFHALKHRHTSMACACLFISVALIAMPGLAWLLLPRTFTYTLFGLSLNSWRMFILINALPSAIVGFVFLFILPESPKYLYHSGNVAKALDVLAKIYALNTGNPSDSFPVKSLAETPTEKTDSKNMLRVMWTQTAPLIKPPYLKYTLAGCVLQGATFAVSSGLLLWYPDILNQLATAEKGNAGLTVCQALANVKPKNETMGGSCNAILDDQIFIQNIIVGSVYMVCYTLWGVVVRTLGNRNVIIGCLGISSSALVLLLFLSQKIVIDVLFVVMLVLPGIAVAMINLEIVDLVPTYLCGMAVCLIMTAGRLGSVISSSVVGLMLQWNCTITFGLYSTSLIVGLLLLVFIFPKKRD